MDQLAVAMVDQMSTPTGAELMPEPPKDLGIPSYALGQMPPPEPRKISPPKLPPNVPPNGPKSASIPPGVQTEMPGTSMPNQEPLNVLPPKLTPNDLPEENNFPHPNAPFDKKEMLSDKRPLDVLDEPLKPSERGPPKAPDEPIIPFEREPLKPRDGPIMPLEKGPPNIPGEPLTAEPPRKPPIAPSSTSRIQSSGGSRTKTKTESKSKKKSSKRESKSSRLGSSQTWSGGHKRTEKEIIPLYIGQPCYTEFNHSPFMYEPFTTIPNPKEDRFAAREINENPFTTFSPMISPMSMPPFMPSELGQPSCGPEARSSNLYNSSSTFPGHSSNFPGLNPMSGSYPEPIIDELPGSSKDVHFLVDDIEWELLQSRYQEADIVDAIYKEYTRRLERLKDFHFKPAIKSQLRSLQQVMNALHLHAKYSERSKKEILQLLLPKKKKKKGVDDLEDTDEIIMLKNRLKKLRERFNRNRKFDDVFPMQKENERFVIQSFQDGMRQVFIDMKAKCREKAEKDLKEQKENEMNLELMKQLEIIKLQNPHAKEVVIEKNPETGQREIIVRN